MVSSLKKAIPQKIFFILFVSLPLCFSVSYYSTFYKGLQSYEYEPHQCVIIVNERVKISPNDYRQNLVYSYQYNNSEYTGNLYQYGITHYSNSRRFIDKSFRKKDAGDQVECFINPDNSAEAVIVQGPVTRWYEIFLFTALLIIGLWGLLTAFLRPEWAEENMIMDGDVT